MGTKRVGLARVEALMENLKRELDLGGSSLKGVRNADVTVRSATTAHDLTATASDATIVYTGAQAGAITLPQATAANAGMVIKIIFGANASGTEFKLGFANGGSTKMIGTVSLCDFDSSAAPDQTALVANAKCIIIDSDDNAHAGGAIGSHYTFTYYGADLVHLSGVGVTTGGTPALTGNGESSATGI